jgi:DNA-binding XRE family transcriptional regulator
MNSTGYKATRKRLGMTQDALAAALDVSRKAIIEREAGGTIKRESAMALELLELRSTPKRRKGTNDQAVPPLVGTSA